MKKVVLGLLGLLFLSVGSSHALILEFINLNFDGLMDRFAEMQFAAPGNDFGWAMFWLPTKSLDIPEAIHLDGETKYCKKLVKWLYYNSQRWERLWPLDAYTLGVLRQGNASYNNLSMSGGIYTACDENLYGIFGQVNYLWSGQESSIIAGTKLDYQGNWLSGEFADSFEYFNNTLPLWYLVDSVGGIGFVWWVLTWHDCLICMLNQNCSDPSCNVPVCSGDSIGELFVTSGDAVFQQSGCAFYFSWWVGTTGDIGDIQRGITIQWNVGLSQSLDSHDRQTLLWNYKQKISVINVPKVNIGTLINTVRKKAQNLCRWRVNYALESIPAGYDDEVLCINYDEYSSGNQVVIDLSNSTDKSLYLWRTLIVKNADVHIKHSMDENDDAFDLFLDNGNLYLDREMPTYLTSFSREWYPTSFSWETVTEWLFLKGNLIVNGLILWSSGSAVSEVAHKLYVHGKLNSLNTPVEPSVGRETQVDNLLWSVFDYWINFQHVFTWYCNPITGSGSDGVACFEDPFADSPLVIIGQKFDTKLY